MTNSSPSDITSILHDWSEGDADAPSRLMPLVYAELRRLARLRISHERSINTLQPTALVHEAYLRLVDQTRVNWQSRAHFYGVAASMMRRVLIDQARERASQKRGGTVVRLSLDDVQAPLEQRAADLVALDDALLRLSEFDDRKSKIVEMRFFGGLSEDDIASILSISRRTVMREWKVAKLWLYRELSETAE